jgi:hypothetical protein
MERRSSLYRIYVNGRPLRSLASESLAKRIEAWARLNAKRDVVIVRVSK